MLKIIKSARDLNFGQLFAVYEESICACGKIDYSHELPGMRMLMAQQDFYADWKTFFMDKENFCALWLVNGVYSTALRLDRYHDGLLLNTLETAPGARGKGYATNLMKETIDWLKKEGYAKVYSHIDKRNHVSAAIHITCGFHKILDHAVYLDGSVLQMSDTYVLDIS